ncbi:F-box domain-containing protein [Favolaschia claudopus]|uniref:F-box domain-containing protein n=1 Tax=Favolaschia claudopus TaxID=2862362 RepID=A0AAV9ZDD3_9AGAR
MLDFMQEDRTFLAETYAQIQAFTAQISELEDAIARLREAQQLALDRLNSYKYPVLSLPDEMVCEIFVRFLPPYPDPSPLVGLLSPTTLTHVCRRWREVALATPDLWKAIDLIPPDCLSQISSTRSIGTIPLNSLHQTRARTLGSLWIKRSGTHPLSIRAVDLDNPSFPIFSTLLPHRARLEHLTLHLRSGLPLLKLTTDPLPRLRSLNLWFQNGLTRPVVLTDVPLLRVVVLGDVRVPSIALPWAQLTSLTLRSVYPEHIMRILRQSANLLDCTLLFWAAEEPARGDPEPDVVLWRLQTLVVETESEVIVEFFQHLVAPSLCRLEAPDAFFLWGGGTSSSQALHTFIAKSGCKLHKLCITEL